MSFSRLRGQIESKISQAIREMGEKNRLRDACEYALTNGGKRLRPILVFLIADALGERLDVSDAALSVEYFHTASLIADDLPSMDNDDFRRNRPSVHKVFGESIALLASYTLIAAGYGGIHANGKKMKENPQYAERADEVSVLCLEAATRCAGFQGATNGQFLDLYPPDHSLETIQKIIYQKTITLFEIAFVFGWLFGGGKIALLDLVRKCAYHLGMAFQIADDLQDLSQENGINIALAFGVEKAGQLFKEEVQSFEREIKNLGLWTKSFEKIVDWLWRLGPPEVVNL